MNNQVKEHTLSDDDLMRHIGYCGVLVTVVALGFGWIANSVV